ncbi:MAG: class I SAM-dependent methyltransferase family protein [Thaumarchaeota archaeon]|nr:class I SAM-dependent methyltransferase family protein [Nitrososphaerota archaeon]
MVGDIAIVKLRPGAEGKEEVLAEAILAEMRSVKCVYGQEGGIEGDFRLRKLRHLGGEERTTTVHKENGIRLRLDVETCYFSPRLSTERLRVASGVAKGEKVLNMFAGVGPYSILIAKKTRVWSCELNHAAVTYHLENNRLNKVEEGVEVIEGDAMLLPDELEGEGPFDRILMPHPSQSNLFLPVALSMLATGGVVHYYRHVSGEDSAEAEESLVEEVSRIAPGVSVSSVRRVRVIGPRYIELVADLKKP